jgi:cyclopropane fatty-acyl-phospholipid synthase-like methyltransferase
MPVALRFPWAAAVIAAAPTDQVLEIGCGAGLLVEQLAAGLTTGTVTALDKSKPMIARAAKRNNAWIATNRVTLFASSLADAALPKGSFHKIVAFNVNFFWKPNAPELALVKKYLRPGGRLYVFHQAPAKGDRTTVPAIVASLTSDSWRVIDTQSKTFQPAPAHVVIATRA